jgi:hypothetical protein
MKNGRNLFHLDVSSFVNGFYYLVVNTDSNTENNIVKFIIAR